MFWYKMARNNTLLLLVVLATSLQRIRPTSAAVIANHNDRMTKNKNLEEELKIEISKENYTDLESITKLHHDQQMAWWTRSEVADGPPSWPCPDATAISPCTCSSIESPNHALHVDCSLATTDTEIVSAFSVVFPFDDVYNFTIETNGASNTIGTFTQNIFQSKWFSSIYIVETNLETIEESVFALSHNTLETLSLQRNKIIEFPFQTFAQYNKLRNIHLNGNNIKELPILSSNIIHELNMNKNLELVLKYDENTFDGMTELRTLKLSNTAVSRVPPNLFSKLNYISHIELSGNGIQYLEPLAINAPGLTIKKLDLSDNSLAGTVQLGSITGLATDGELNLKNNKIVELTEAAWKPIFDQLGTSQLPSVGSVILDGNPLLCGCDINWIIIDDIQWDKISAGTTCPGGLAFADLDKNFYLTRCPQPQTLLELE